MATQATLDQIQQIYIAYYGRPADQTGLDFWAAALEANGGDVDSIINAFANSAESTALYGSAPSPTSLVTSIYENLLHRAPDSEGLQFYVQELTSGALTPGNLALAVLDGARNSDIATVQNELAAANQFTAQALTYAGDTAAAIARTFLLQVSGDSTAQSELLAQLTSWVNAASAATTDPSQFAGKIAGGVLTDLSIIGEYAAGTTPSTGDDTSGSVPTFTMNVDATTHIVSFTSAAGTISIVSIAAGGSGAGSVTITAANQGQTASITVPGSAAETVAFAGFDVASGQTVSVSDKLAAGLSISGAGTVLVTDSGTAGTYDLTGIASTIQFSIAAGHTDTLLMTVAQVTETGLTSGYALLDSFAHISAAGSAVITQAGSYTLTDASGSLGALTVAQESLVTHASNASSYTFTLVDSIANLGGHTSDAGVTAYSIVDTLANLVSGANAAIVEGAASHTLTDASANLGALTVSAADMAHSATNGSSYDYSVTDTSVALADALIADDAALTQASLLSVSDTSTPSLTLAEAQALSVHDLLAATYDLADTAADLLDAAAQPIVVGAHAVSLSADAPGLTVEQATTLAALPSFGLAGHSLTLADTLANLVGNTTLAGASAYTVVDTVQDILTDSHGLVPGAAAVELSADAIGLSVHDASELAATPDFSVNGHIVTLNDSVANLVGNTDVASASSYTVTDTLANIANDVGASDNVVLNAATIVMKADSSVYSNQYIYAHHLLLTLEGSASTVTLALASDTPGNLIDTSQFAGSVTINDTAQGDTFLTGSGSTTVIERSGHSGDTVFFGSDSGNTDTLLINTIATVTDTVHSFVAGQDQIASNFGGNMTIGAECGANASGIASFATLQAFATALAQTSGTANDVIAWVDTAHGNTYVATFNGVAGAHVVELVGVSASALQVTGGATTVLTAPI